MEKTMEYLLLAIVFALIICPPRYDPAIRLKEFLDEQRRLYEEEKARLTPLQKGHRT